MLGAGKPAAVTVKLLVKLPIVKLVLSGLVMDGGSLMVRLKVWVAAVPTLFTASSTKVYGVFLPVPTSGVPLIAHTVSLFTTLLVMVSPLGKVELLATRKVAAGKPLAASLKLSAMPAVKIVASGLVKLAGSFTVRVKFTLAFWPKSLDATTAKL